MKTIHCNAINEDIFFEELSCGLELYYLPMPGRMTSYAIMGVNFGSRDTLFIPYGKKEPVRVNDGIAHFLEHKMFEQPDGSDAFKRFSELGANANAFTNFNRTAYLFMTTDNFYECLRHLVDYVNTPYYTDENVEKEKGIICQEINMYKDNPYTQVYFNTLKGMYSRNNLNVDIAGSIESVNAITKEELYDCYNTFYRPENMKLFVTGDLDFDRVKTVVEEVYESKKGNLNLSGDRYVAKAIYDEEPKEVAVKSHEEIHSISMPNMYIGFKDNSVGYEANDIFKKDVSGELAVDLIAGTSTEFYEQLYLEGLINDTFGGFYTAQGGYGYAIFGGETPNPDELKLRLKNRIEDVIRDGIDDEEFEVLKRMKTGLFLKKFDAMVFMSNNFLDYSFNGINILDYLDELRTITKEYVEERIKEVFADENSVASVIKGNE